MKLRYLLDEHLPRFWQEALLQRDPLLEVLMMDDPGAPACGTKDPEILRWCEENEFVLVTDNRNTMGWHLLDHLAAGFHIPGVFQLPSSMPLSELFDELVLIAGTALPGEYADHIRNLPISD